MDSQYENFIKEDSKNSLVLMQNLNVPDFEYGKIEQWFSEYLVCHAKSDDFNMSVIYENELQKKYDELAPITGESASKYMIGKLITYINITDSGYLRSTLIARLSVLLQELLKDYIETQKICFSPLEFLSITEYTKNCFFVSPNGELLENLLKIEKSNKICANANTEQRERILKNMLSVIAQKEYHHDIQCFKKILNLITKDDETLVAHIKNYCVNNRQGCYTYINIIMNRSLSADTWDDFILKKEAVTLFDTAKGAHPKDSWLNKYRELQKRLELNNILWICTQISERENLKNYAFTNYTWSDDVAKRFLKSAQWIQEFGTA